MEKRITIIFIGILILLLLNVISAEFVSLQDGMVKRDTSIEENTMDPGEFDIDKVASIEDDQAFQEAIEMIIKENFQEESESCKNEYRELQNLFRGNETCESVQKYIDQVTLTTCTKNTDGFQVIAMVLYELYRNCAQDASGHRCNEEEAQIEFDKLGLCENECIIKIANYLYIMKNYLEGQVMEENQDDLINTCAVIVDPTVIKENLKEEENLKNSVSSGSSLFLISHFLKNFSVPITLVIYSLIF